VPFGSTVTVMRSVRKVLRAKLTQVLLKRCPLRAAEPRGAYSPKIVRTRIVKASLGLARSEEGIPR